MGWMDRIGSWFADEDAMALRAAESRLEGLWAHLAEGRQGLGEIKAEGIRLQRALAEAQGERDRHAQRAAWAVDQGQRGALAADEADKTALAAIEAQQKAEAQCARLEGDVAENAALQDTLSTDLDRLEDSLDHWQGELRRLRGQGKVLAALQALESEQAAFAPDDGLEDLMARARERAAQTRARQEARQELASADERLAALKEDKAP